METVDISRFFVSFAFIIFLMWLSAFLFKRFGLDKRLRGITGSSGRLQVCDVLYLDPKRKLLLVAADKTEYLLLLSGDSATVLSSMPKTKDVA